MNYGASFDCTVMTEEGDRVGEGNSLNVYKQSPSLEQLEHELCESNPLGKRLKPFRDHLFTGYKVFGENAGEVASVLIDADVDLSQVREVEYYFENNLEVEFPVPYCVIFEQASPGA